MHLSFGMGVFWLFVTWAAGDTTVKVAQAFSKRGSRKDSGVGDLEKRVRELEQRVSDQAEMLEARELMLTRLEEKVEFTDKLLSDSARPGRTPPRS